MWKQFFYGPVCHALHKIEVFVIFDEITVLLDKNNSVTGQEEEFS